MQLPRASRPVIARVLPSDYRAVMRQWIIAGELRRCSEEMIIAMIRPRAALHHLEDQETPLRR